MQSQYYPIHKWAKTDRPREKLLSKSPQALSTTELLAIILRTGGGPRTSALELSAQILSQSQNNLQELSKLSIKELMRFKGIGLAKATTLAAALELGRRRQASQYLDKLRIVQSRDLAAWLQTTLQDLSHEVFGVAYLNNAGKMLDFVIISEGGLTGTTVDIRLVLKKALELDAINLILCHNHPSGLLLPSEADRNVTANIRDGAALLNIRLLDHIIVSEEGFYSFADNNLL